MSLIDWPPVCEGCVSAKEMEPGSRMQTMKASVHHHNCGTGGSEVKGFDPPLEWPHVEQARKVIY